MADAERKDGSSFDPVIADIGANLVVILLILIALSAQATPRTTRPAADPVAATLTAPASGREQSDLLHRRLRPLPDQLILELTPSGPARPLHGNRTLPLADLPDPPPASAIVFVFSPRHHADLIARLAAARIPVTEVTVPDALRWTGEGQGLSAFSDSFLSLRVTDDPASLRPPLLRLLTNGKSGAAHAQATRPSTWDTTLRWLHLCANLTGAVLSGYALFRTNRRPR